MKNYFRKLKEDTDGIPIFAGGIQINLNGKELADNLTEITNSGTLLQQILPALKLNKFN